MKKTLVTLLLILCLCGPTFAHDLQDALSRIDAHMVLAAPADGSAWTRGDCVDRVIRSGSWYGKPNYVRTANRFWYPTYFRNNNLGFSSGQERLRVAPVTSPRRRTGHGRTTSVSCPVRMASAASDQSRCRRGTGGNE